MAVHPEHRNEQGYGRPNVVVMALRNVQDTAWITVHSFERTPEVMGRRLIASCLFGCHDEVECDVKPPEGVCKQVIIDVGENPETVAEGA